MATKREGTRSNPGRGGKGTCGGSRRKDGTGGGIGNRGTTRQPKPTAKPKTN